ncbi:MULTISPECIES: hypothetical protein [unclassified Microcoleus]|uniref:hypothetical protein n=1 Tax=unclassified Microcoleus TaxID=2642155 RepID=UPI002FD73D34
MQNRSATEGNITTVVDGIGTGVVICPEQFCAEQQQYLVRRHIAVRAKDEV